MKRLPVLFLTILLLIPSSGYVLAAEDFKSKAISGINQSWLEEMKDTPSWGRNPFNFPRSGGEPGSSGGLQLTAIMFHKEAGIAIINNQVVRTGDSIGERKVVSILRDRVVIRDLIGVYELTLEPFAIE
jgi:hypothetical protein